MGARPGTGINRSKVAGGRISAHDLTVRKPPTLFLAGVSLAALAGLVALAAFLGREQAPTEEPSWNGRSLSEWLAIYESELESGSDSPERDRAAEAVRAIGPPALPFLLQWIEYEPPCAVPVLPPDEDPIHLLTWRTERRGNEAVRGFAFLGTNAHACIPELTSMMRDKTRPNAALRAMAALALMGPRTFPHLTSALADTNQAFRDRLCRWIAGCMAPAVGTNACLPHLRAAMEDPDPRVRQAASAMITRLTGGSGSNAPPH